MCSFLTCSIPDVTGGNTNVPSETCSKRNSLSTALTGILQKSMFPHPLVDVCVGPWHNCKQLETCYLLPATCLRPWQHTPLLAAGPEHSGPGSHCMHAAAAPACLLARLGPTGGQICLNSRVCTHNKAESLAVCKRSCGNVHGR